MIERLTASIDRTNTKITARLGSKEYYSLASYFLKNGKVSTVNNKAYAILASLGGSAFKTFMGITDAADNNLVDFHKTSVKDKAVKTSNLTYDTIKKQLKPLVDAGLLQRTGINGIYFLEPTLVMAGYPHKIFKLQEAIKAGINILDAKDEMERLDRLEAQEKGLKTGFEKRRPIEKVYNDWDEVIGKIDSNTGEFIEE